MSHSQLLAAVAAHYDAGDTLDREVAARDLATFLDALESGQVRAAEPDGSGQWRANAAVKKGILLGFRLGELTEFSAGALHFSDKHTFPPQTLPLRERNIRIVPGGSSVRRGAFIGKNVTLMPPAYVNVGAYVGDGTMVDSHALVGSCAQIGAGVHLSAAAQVGGVLEPVGQTPVVIEDGALIGGNCGVYEGVRVGSEAVLAAGCVVTASTPVYDLVHEQVLRSEDGIPVAIPPRAVVIPGTRPARGEWAREQGLQLNALLIVKYRDASTDARTALEDALR